MGLAAAVRQLELTHRLVVLARHAHNHVSHQLAQVEGGKGEGEELLRVFINRSFAALHNDLV